VKSIKGERTYKRFFLFQKRSKYYPLARSVLSRQKSILTWSSEEALPGHPDDPFCFAEFSKNPHSTLIYLGSFSILHQSGIPRHQHQKINQQYWYFRITLISHSSCSLLFWKFIIWKFKFKTNPKFQIYPLYCHNQKIWSHAAWSP
jgi:hypothetical protein